MRKFALILGCGLLAAVACAQQKYQPSDSEMKDLKIAQQAAIISSMAQQQQIAACTNPQLEQARTQFNADLTKLREESEKIKKAHSWPEGTLFDMQNLTFSEPKAAPAPKVESKK